MESARKNTKTHVLITDVGSFLGAELAKSALATNCVVYGVGHSHLSHGILSNRDFTLLEIDLAQPIPAYLPEFDIIFDLSLLKSRNYSHQPHLSPQVANTISLAKRSGAKVALFAPITTSSEFYDYLTAHHDFRQLSLFLVGDLYGPGMSLEEENRLTRLIKEAVKSNKIILENEGLEHVYPAYITDIVFAVNKFTFTEDSKKIHYLTSEAATTTLSVAYELQNALSLAAGKEVGLFFAGREAHFFSEPEVKVITHDLGFKPKVSLKEGLKKTLEYFELKELIEETEPERQEHLKAHEQKDTVFTPPAVESASRLPKFPRVSSSISVKKIILATLVILILTIAKTGLDIFLGSKDIKAAQKSLETGDFKKARSKATSANKAFTAANNKIGILTYPLSFTRKAQIKDIERAAEAATEAAAALISFVDGAEILAHDFSIIANPDVKNEGFDLEQPSASFKKAYQQSSRARELLENTKLPLVSPKLEKARAALARLHAASLRSWEIANLTNDFIGAGGKKTYLVLLQNNTELRPGGGFIGNFAEVTFEEGRLKGITVEDIYTIDGQLKEKIEPPQQIKEKLGIESLYLRDSNWSPDFEVNAKTARDFFKKETGRDVDGVIATDLTLVQDVLAKMGPVTLTDYGEQITAQNLFERGEYHSEVGFFPGSTQKRDFFGALTRTIVAKILESLKKIDQEVQDSPWLALIEGSAQGLPQKHLMVTFDNPTLAAFTRTKGWNQPLPPLYFNPAEDIGETRDYVALAEANLGANKVNRYLDRHVSYEMTIGRDADLVGSLKITYINNSQAETWPAGKYVNYLRVYVPFAASLFEHRNGDSSNLEEVETTNQGNLTVFSTYVEVPIKSKKEISFTYRIPKNIKLEEAPTYSIYFQKQAGTGKDPLSFKFNLPAYIEVKSVDGQEEYKGSQNITIDTDLSTDRKFEIGVAKN